MMQMYENSLFSCSSDKYVRKWDTENCLLKTSYVGSPSAISCLQVQE